MGVFGYITMLAAPSWGAPAYLVMVERMGMGSIVNRRGCLVFFAGVLLLTIWMFISPSSKNTSVPQIVKEQPSVPILLPTLRPTVVRLPTATPAPFEQLKALLIAELSEDRLSQFDWHSEDKQIAITFAGSDSLTEDMIRSWIQIDIVDVLRTIQANATLPYESVSITVTFPMRDVYGNTTGEPVVRATYEREELEKINWSGFSARNVYLMSNQDTLFLHRDMRP